MALQELAKLKRRERAADTRCAELRDVVSQLQSEVDRLAAETNARGEHTNPSLCGDWRLECPPHSRA